MSRRRRIPRRVCPGCGAHHYAWRESQPCAACAPQAQENQSALAAELRRRRIERRAGYERERGT